MMRKLALLLLISIIALMPGASAIRTFSGDTVSIDVPIADDVFATGGVVNINAPVSSAVVAGGTVNINAPVTGDLFVAGGQVLVNSNIGGKVVAWGGTINLMGNVSTNVVLAGGNVNVHPKAIVGRDAIIGGGDVRSAGRIHGNLTVSANNFYNTGTAGRINFQQIRSEGEASGWPDLFGMLMLIGYLVLGIILIKFFPSLVLTVDGEIRRSPAVKALAGLASIVVALVLTALIFLTVVGIPVALVLAMAVAICLMTSGLFASFSLGRVAFDLLKFQANDITTFCSGFIILNALFYLPMAGWLIKLIAISLGFGAIVYLGRDRLRGPSSHI
jgi:hypothetical protein